VRGICLKKAQKGTKKKAILVENYQNISIWADQVEGEQASILTADPDVLRDRFPLINADEFKY
jgi:hypothetical protein